MAITNKVLEFTLELTPGGIPPIIHASQGDVGRTFKANVVWNGSAASAYISGTTVKIRGKKPDKTVFEYDGLTTSNNTVTFETKEQMTIIPGPVECELVFTSGDDVVASANFVLIVEDSPYNPDALSESDVLTLADAVAGMMDDAIDAKFSAFEAEFRVTADNIDDGAVITAKIANNAITSEKIKDGEVKTVDIADANVATAKLAANAVTSDKIADGAVTTAKIADNAITSEKIKDGEVKTADIADANVTTAKLAANAVTSDKIADGAVNTADIANNAVTYAKLDPDITAAIREIQAIINRGITTGGVLFSQGAVTFANGRLVLNSIN